MFRNACLAIACLSFSITAAAAQEGVLSEIYGSGVHAYFAGRSDQALTLFTEAIDAGSTDPRAFYFRGLTYVQLGYSDAARDDFTRAAALEVKDANEFFDVSRSLERIQGPQRLGIERYRQLARLEAYKRARKLEYERYERIRRAEPNVTLPPEPDEPLPAPVDPFDTKPEMEEPELEPEMPAEEPEVEVIEEEAEMPAEEEPLPPEPDLPAPDEPLEVEPALEDPVPEPEEQLPDVELPSTEPEDPFGS
jgi:tetratricopeptide (TPR) repeat protein